MVITGLSKSEQLRRLAGRCLTYTTLFLVASLPLYPTRMYLRVFITAITTGLCYGAASVITGYFDRWGWKRASSLSDWKTIAREFSSAQDNRL
jgi:hypothetical protein